MKRSRAFQTLGLARRAGAVVIGTQAAREAVREDAAELVVIAADAAEGQARKLTALLEHRAIPVRVAGTQDELGGALGVGPVSAVAVTVASFAEQLLSRLDEESGRSKEDRRYPPDAG